MSDRLQLIDKGRESIVYCNLPLSIACKGRGKQKEEKEGFLLIYFRFFFFFLRRRRRERFWRGVFSFLKKERGRVSFLYKKKVKKKSAVVCIFFV